MAVLVLASPPTEADSPGLADAQPAVVAEQAMPEPRTGPELRDAVRAALQRWARVEDEQAKTAAGEFLTLFSELRRDEKLSRSQCEELATKVRSRLAKLTVQIKKRVAIEKRLAKQQPESLDELSKRPDILAQPGGFGGGMRGGGMGPGMMGRGGMMGGGMGQTRQIPDDGEALVELIQTVIAPASWDVNGGPGSIYYWQPGRAIVVRQTGDVHGEIADVLKQMGKANR